MNQQGSFKTKRTSIYSGEKEMQCEVLRRVARHLGAVFRRPGTMNKSPEEAVERSGLCRVVERQEYSYDCGGCLLEGLDLRHYYIGGDPNGQKVTKAIGKRLRKLLKGEQLERFNANFAEIANSISTLYLPEMEMTAYWGDCRKLGSGKYDKGSCFGEGGCNHMAPDWLHENRRTRTLVVETTIRNVTRRARCVAYFAGGRKIFLTNFYYQDRVPQRDELLVEGLKSLLGLRKVEVEGYDSPPLPIYLNGDGIVVQANSHASRYNPTQEKWPCLGCGHDYYPHELHTWNVAADGWVYACSDECAMDLAPDYYATERCDVCGECTGGESYYDDDNQWTVCEGCYEASTTCAACDARTYRDDDFTWSDAADGYLCDSCGEECEHCNNVVPHDELDSAWSGGDDLRVCEYCVENETTQCPECGDPVLDGVNNTDCCTEGCLTEGTKCPECGDWVRSVDVVEAQRLGETVMICESCADDLDTCPHCDVPVIEGVEETDYCSDACYTTLQPALF